MLFSPVNNRYTPPQVQTYLTNGKAYSDPQFREILAGGPIVQTRPYEAIKQAYDLRNYACPELPASSTYLQPKRSETRNNEGVIEYVGKHFAPTNNVQNLSYYEQEKTSETGGWFYTPYYRLTEYIPHLPEYFIVDTTNISLGYTYNWLGFTSTALPLGEHTGKILFKRDDGHSYLENTAEGTTGYLGNPSGIYQSLPDPSAGYCATYRPVYNITQKFNLNTAFYRSNFYFRYSPAWLWYEFFPSGGGTSFDGTLTSPTWHIGLPCYGANASYTEVWITLQTFTTASGTFTITIDGITIGPIDIDHGATLVANIQAALTASALPYTYIDVTLPALSANSSTFTIVGLVFDSAIGSPYRDIIPIVIVDDTFLVDALLEAGYKKQRYVQELTEVLYLFPSDWYTYTEGQTKEHRKWYAGKPTAQVDFNATISPLNIFGGMSTESSLFTLGSFSPYRETEFYPGSIKPLPTIDDIIITLETTANNVRISNKKVTVFPVYL